MAYNKKQWEDRQSEFPNRRRLAAVAGKENVYEVSREEGLVAGEGDSFDQATMNDLESRVAAGFAETETALAGKANAGHSHGAADVGAAPAGHSHTPASIGAAAASHNHSRGQITDFPASLPANGGNADTVDGYHIAGIGTSAPGSLANNALFFVYE